MSVSSGPARATRLRLARPNERYEPQSEADRNLSLELADRANFKKFEDIDLSNEERLILKSSNGKRGIVTVSDTGTLGTTEIT